MKTKIALDAVINDSASDQFVVMPSKTMIDAT